MGSSKRIIAISSLAGAIAACFPIALIGAPTNRDAIAARTEAALADMRAGVLEKWHREHPKPVPQHAATTIPVTSCADDGSPGTLRAVLETVSTGDVVDLTNVPCDTITLTAGYIVPNLAATDFTIQGPGMGALTISGGHTQQILGNEESGIITINDLSIADGYADNSWGGCLLAFVPTAGFRFTRVSVSGCEAHQVNLQHGSNVFGGAIMAGGMVELVDSVVTGNTLSSELPDSPPYANNMSGGGVFSLLGPVTITRSSITANRIVSSEPAQGIQGGGGIAVYNANYNVAISDSVISNNMLDSSFIDQGERTSALRGAGLFAYAGNTGVGDLVISNTTFDGNAIASAAPLQRIYGGAIAEAMNLTLSYSTLSSNDSAGFAGGLMARGLATSIFNSTFSGNHAAHDGGAIFGGQIVLDNSTIAFNTSDTGGGGLDLGGTCLLRSSIVARNTGGVHPDIMLLPNATVGGNADFVGDPAGVIVPPFTLTGDPMLGPLADNGGPTRTHALLEGSTAIDAGDNPRALQFDQRGPGFARISGGEPDIGAFEFGDIIEDEIFADGFDL